MGTLGTFWVVIILYNICYWRKTFLIGDSKELRGLKDAIYEDYFFGRYII